MHMLKVLNGTRSHRRRRANPLEKESNNAINMESAMTERTSLIAVESDSGWDREEILEGQTADITKIQDAAPLTEPPARESLTEIAARLSSFHIQSLQTPSDAWDWPKPSLHPPPQNDTAFWKGVVIPSPTTKDKRIWSRDLLVKMDWKEGKGLGRSLQGIRKPIKSSKVFRLGASYGVYTAWLWKQPEISFVRSSIN